MTPTRPTTSFGRKASSSLRSRPSDPTASTAACVTHSATTSVSHSRSRCPLLWQAPPKGTDEVSRQHRALRQDRDRHRGGGRGRRQTGGDEETNRARPPQGLHLP